MNRCVIVGGSMIGNYEFVRDHIRVTDYVIYCDCGLSHMEKLGAALLRQNQEMILSRRTFTQISLRLYLTSV